MTTSLDQSKVLVGSADQETTGAIASGTPITDGTSPANFSAAQTLAAGQAALGYLSTDGITVSTEYSTKSLQEMNLAKVRTLLTDFSGTIKFTLIQFDLAGAQAAFGADNVTSETNGFHIKLGAHLPARRCYTICLKDGDDALIVVIPNGQVTSGADLTFKADEAIELPIEIDCLDDGSGESVHVYYNHAAASGNGNS